MEKALFAGMPFSLSIRQRIEKSYPSGTISLTHGPLDALEERETYLVRIGEKTVIMPRMRYGESVEKQLEIVGHGK